MKAQNLSRRQACWALYLSRFDFTLIHVPGTKIGKAITLPDFSKRMNNQKEKTFRRNHMLKHLLPSTILEKF